MRARNPLSATALLLAVLAAGVAPVLAQDGGSGGGQGGSSGGGGGSGTGDGGSGSGSGSGGGQGSGQGSGNGGSDDETGSSGTTGDMNAPANERSTSDQEDVGGSTSATLPGADAGARGAAPTAAPIVDLSEERIRRVQERLLAEGFDVGPIDGAMGTRTLAALREFQRARGFDPTGEPNEATLTELGVE